MVRDEETGVTNGIGRGILGFLFSSRRIILTVRYLTSASLSFFSSFSLSCRNEVRIKSPEDDYPEAN